MAVLTLVPALVVSGLGTSAAAAQTPFSPLEAPARLLDTRPGRVTIDHQFEGVGVVPAGGTVSLTVAGRGGVSDAAAAVVLNVTVVGPTSPGYVTAYPCGTTRPTTSSLNYVAGAVVANAVVAKVGTDGRVCLYSTATTDLLVDASGSFAPEGITPLASPARLLDTRHARPTADGAFSGTGRMAAGSTLTLTVAGRVGIPTGAASVVLNVTGINPRAANYMTVYPCGVTRPTSSNLNLAAGESRPNAVIAKVGSGRAVCLYTAVETDAAVDVSAVLPSTSFAALPSPARLLDTRAASTVDGTFVGTGREPAGATAQLQVAGRGGVPAGASAVVLNVTAVAPDTSGLATAYPDGATPPTASSLNYSAHQTVANLVVARLGPTGSVCLRSSARADLVVDVAGYLAAPPGATTGDPCPSLAPTTTEIAARTALVSRPDLQRVVGQDRIAVVKCQVPAGSQGYSGSSSITTDAATVAAFATSDVAPYYARVTGGRYTATFTALPTVIALSPTETPEDCLTRATTAVGAPYTSVLATDDRDFGDGFGGPGSYPTDPRSNPSVLSRTPQVSHRGMWVGGGSTSEAPNAMIIAHEIGHTLHWPHSYIGPDQYDNPVDVMSGSPGAPGAGWCDYTTPTPAYPQGFSSPCVPQNTTAFNRMAAGWLDTGQVALASGVANYTLGPATGSGVQLVAVPDPADPYSVLTIEGRPAVGDDSLLSSPYLNPSTGVVGQGHDGVAVHLVRQGVRGSQVSLDRRERQATGVSSSFTHVLSVGQSLTVGGVTVRVLARTGDTFTVRVYGRYTTPSVMSASAAAKARTVLPTDTSSTRGADPVGVQPCGPSSYREVLARVCR